MTSHKIIIGDSSDMSEIKDKKIQLIVTSPPYWNLKKYGAKGLGRKESYSIYIEGIKKILVEMKRVLEPGRFAVINVGTAVSNEGMMPINGDIVKIMEELGFTFRKEIIWIKPKGTQGLWQRGTTKYLKSEPYPGYFNLNIMHEYILIFQNEGEMKIERSEKTRLTEEYIKKIAWSMWDLRVSYTKGHPAPFPEEIPNRLIQMYTVKGDTVLDPFGGSGTTMKVAEELGRNSIIYEIHEDFLDIIREKIKQKSYRGSKHTIAIRQKN